MKKIIYALIIPLLFITRVNASTFNGYYNLFDNNYYAEDYSTQIDTLISYWNTNYRTNSSNYIIFFYSNPSPSCANNVCRNIQLIPLTSSYVYGSNASYDVISRGTTGVVSFIYWISSANSSLNGTYGYYLDDTNPINTSMTLSAPYSSYQSLTYISSNSENTLTIPSYTQGDYNFPSYTLTNGDNFPTYEELINDTYNPIPNDNYVEINLKNYDYVILSLRNYNQSSFSTPIYTLGSLCITRVADYGMKEINQLVPGYKTPSCTTYYTSLTPVNLYVDTSILNQHPVYYISSEQNERPNTISVDSSIFNISYITSSNADNPTVIIDGRSYPVIPYENLTDTAIISTNEGYVSGQVCSPFDNNCILNQNNIDSFDSIFSHPLSTLESVWNSIISVFNVISAFLTLLPTPLQTFLYLSFMLGIILGLIKILL